MSTPTDQGTAPEKSLKTSIGAFGLSLILHVSVLLLVGGYVIYEGVVPKTAFVPVDGVAGGPEADVLPEPEETEIMTMPDSPTVSNDLAIQSTPAETNDIATSSDLIVSTGINPTFSLPPATGAVAAIPRLGTGSGASGSGTNSAENTNPSAGKVVRTLFGTSQTDKPVLVGRFYDASRRKNGDPIGIATMAAFGQNVQKWAAERGKASFLKDLYWESKKLLYATQVIIPGGETKVAFESFGEKAVTPNPAFIIHYTARIALPEAKTFRFNVIGNDHVVVLIDGKVVAAADTPGQDWVNNPPDKRTKERFGWESPEPLLFPSKPSYNRYTRGDWLNWAANEYHKIDILVGDAAVGGDFYVFVEEQGKKYEVNNYTKTFNAHAGNQGIPILPIFRVDRVRLSDDLTERGFLRDVGYDDKGPVFLVEEK